MTTVDQSQNLSLVRGPSVWSREDFAGHPSHATARLVAGGAGVGLLLAALTARSGRRSGGLALLGTALVSLAASGRGMGDLRGWLQRQIASWRREDEVDEASEQSFPASDSPSWMAGGEPTHEEPPR